MASNRAYLAHIKRLKSEHLFPYIKLHTTVMRPLRTCGSETRTITAEETNELRVCEEEDCKENMWTRKRRKRLDNNRRQGDKGMLQGEFTVNYIKSLP